MPLAITAKCFTFCSPSRVEDEWGDTIEGFHNTWNMVLSELATMPDKDTLQFVYYNQIKDFKPLF